MQWLVLVTLAVSSVWGDNNFCTDPVDTICHNPENMDQTLAQQKLLSEIKDAYLKSSYGPHKKHSEPSLPKPMTRKKWAMDVAPFMLLTVLAYKEHFSLSPDEIEDLHAEETVLQKLMKRRNLNFRTAEDYTRQTIKAALEKNPDLSEADRKKLRKMTRVHVQTIDTFYSKLPKDFLKKAIGEFSLQSVCGKEGIDSNAFYYPETETVVVCPGVVANIVASAKNQKELNENFAMLLGHEFGHSSDFGYYPKAYAQLESCFQEGIDRNKGGRDIKEKMREASADFWGSSTVTEIAKSENLTPDETVGLLQKAYAILCMGNDKDGDHGTRADRIKVFLSSNSILRTHMGCPSDSGLSCSLGGKVTPSAEIQKTQDGRTP